MSPPSNEIKTNQTKNTPQIGTEPFFKPVIQPKLFISHSNDPYEQEADAVADKVMRMPVQGAFFTPAPKTIQRQVKEAEPAAKTSEVITEGAGIVWEQLKEQPGFEEWKKEQTTKLKYKLWDSQPTELKLGVVGFGLSSAGLLGAAIATDPSFRAKSIETLQDKNLALPLSLLPYSEYFGVSGFKYRLPSAENAPYTFETDLSLGPFFELMRQRWAFPKLDLDLGIKSTYSEQSGFKPLTGGSIKLKLGGGIVNISGFYNQPLPPSPVLISNPTEGESPVWLMRTLPSQLEESLPAGTGIFFTVDVLRIPELLNPQKNKPKPKIQRKANDSSPISFTAPPIVSDVLSSGQGSQLENPTRQFMESSFGKDFSQVRIHTGDHAAQSAKAIQAKAYTSGNHIVFDKGQYQPSSEAGKGLLAHELVHVIQQDNTVHRKETATVEPAEITEIRTKLESGSYPGAWLQLNDLLGWEGINKKKAWLAQHPDIRQLFLRHLPATVVAEVYSAEELVLKSSVAAFTLIDCWYQTEEEKSFIYSQNLPLFDHILRYISPYTGEPIKDVVAELTKTIGEKKYPSSFNNKEFHIIHLLAPTVERKLLFYHKFEQLFKTVSKKFDPYTGIRLQTMEYLTDTNEVNREQALKIYEQLKVLPEEQRRAFIDVAFFAGALEADKDAEAYYKKKFRAQYKALPHNWDSAIWPWNWGKWDAPFAERLTIDHVELMSSALNYEDKATRKFGFDRGIDSKTDPAAGKNKSDADRLLLQIRKTDNFSNPQRLSLLLAIAVRAGLESRITERILKPKNEAGEITPALLVIVESYGFVASDGFRYHADKAMHAKHDSGQTWYIIKQTLFGGKSGKVLGEQRGTFDLRKLQDTEENKGSLGGMRIGNKPQVGDEFYNNEWLDKQVSEHSGSQSLLANLSKTKGRERTGKIFASIHNKNKQANIYASTIPLEGLNFFAGGALYRSGPGVLQGIAINLSWTKDTSDPDNTIHLLLGIDNIQLDHFQVIAPKSTLAIGHIGMKGFRITLSQENIPAAQGLFIGLLKNADFTLKALLGLLPNVLKLLPYAIMTMTEEFKGAKVHVYKDALAALMRQDFSSLKSSLSFTSLSVKNLYDTTAGFLDDFSIKQRDKENNLIRQGFVIRETYLWTIDAARNIKGRIRSLDRKIRAEKAELVGNDLDKKLDELEKEKAMLMEIAVEKGLKYENRDEEMSRLREISQEIRKLTQELDAQFEKERMNNPLYNPLTFKVLETEKEKLLKDLEYLDNQYFADKKIAEGKKGGIERFEARERKAEFEAKYKSFEVDMALRGISLKGGGYVRDLINDSLQSLGFESPSLEGVENINIGALQSSFTASGKGASSRKEKPGVAIRRLNIPLIKAPAIAFKTDNLLIEADTPRLQNVFVSLRIDFAANPLDRDPNEPYQYKLESLWIGYAIFNGLTLKMGKAAPLLDFPSNSPVEVWGLQFLNYDPKLGNIHLKIRDVKAQGKYEDVSPAEKTSQKIGFGIDTTTDNETKEGRRNAIEIQYNKEDQNIATRLNISSVWLPSLDIQSPTLSITSVVDTNAVEVKEIRAILKILLEKEASSVKEAKPASIEINSLHLGEISAQGIKVVMREEADTSNEKDKGKTQRINEVTLSKQDKVSIKDLNVRGLRITLGDEGPTLGTIQDNASIKVGDTNLSGVGFAEKNTRGSVLKAISIHSGQFDSLTLEALGRNGREYTLKEFFKFFGRTRLEGLEATGSFSAGKTSGTIGVVGKKNQAISVDYHEPEKDNPGYYRMRLPLSRINIPALNIETGDHIIIIPGPKSKSNISHLNDVDVRLKAFMDFGEKDKLSYDIYLESLDIADMAVFGLEYHNKAMGIDVVFEKNKPLHIPNVKAGGFRFSSTKGFDVFGKAGGWVTAAGGTEAIEASFESIQARLTDGGFLAESEAGRSALRVDIASLGFNQDKAGNMTVTLGKIQGGFPKMTIKQTDPATGAKSVTTISSIEKALTAEGVVVQLGADKNKVIDVTGLTAGGIKIVSEETKGKEVSTATVNLAGKALGATSANIKLNADKSKEITLSGITAGEISADLISSGPKGKSEKNVKLPDPKLISVEAVIIKIDPDGNKHITIVKPTIRNFNLRIPSQKKTGDYTNIRCNLKVDGKIELGDGSFATMVPEAPFDAFVVQVPDNVPVQISNLSLEYKDTSETKPSEEGKPKPLTADQETLLDLEKDLEKAKNRLIATPYEFHHGDISSPNPEWPKAYEALQNAEKAYKGHKDKMIGAAKSEAKASMTKKYLDAVQGTVQAKLIAFDSVIPLNIETHKGEKYVEISDTVVDSLKSLITSILGSTVSLPFWHSEDMKAIGKGLQRWYTWATPYTRGLIDAIAEGNAFGAVMVFLKKTSIKKGVLRDDPTMFGLNFNIDTSYGLDISGYDKFSVGLCEQKYKHPDKNDFYNLYGFVEYLGYVSPVLVSLSGRQDAERARRLKEGITRTEKELGEMGIGEAVKEMIAFIQFSLGKESENLKNTIVKNIKGVSFTADISLAPQQVIAELLKERKAGTFTFDKGSKKIDELHIEGAYINKGVPKAIIKIGRGPAGEENISIPGATYLSQDKGTKVSYNSLEVSPLFLTYESDIYQIINKNINLVGLKLAIKK